TERANIARGCIGLTAVNLHAGGNNDPLHVAEKIYGTFEQAHADMTSRNRLLDLATRIPVVGNQITNTRYVLFAKLFWANQRDDWMERAGRDETAFRPDPRTGEVDMHAHMNRQRPRVFPDKKTALPVSGSFVNFDYAFWDEASQSFWHANHGVDKSQPD